MKRSARSSTGLLVSMVAFAALALGACDNASLSDGDVATDLATVPDLSITDAAHDGGTDGSMIATCMVPTVTMCPSPMPHYADVAPIFQSRCQSCHDGHHEEWPLDTYSHVADWAAFIHDDMVTCAMPPPDAGIPITVEERVRILEWLRCGNPQ